MTLAMLIEEQRKEGFAIGYAEGRLKILKKLVQTGKLTIPKAAEYAGLSEEVFKQQAML